ncbi:proteasome component Prs2 [Penicillium digitatum]|uniref:WKF domain-containing protein n=2 Tax=Penicillium digitatum TaxID=36651 RepID=K9G799_PEND1|nr:hypothetical protein PDIP_29740 [Penicillium digitatum Pd1]EKV17810.1 hypothetical protein PDIP_29740 [Penicillium digitatum Pd1]KAG0155162.1 hypothetical protein PDIDSM_735 [Penicillium digitatum]QQK46928.1 proteasome component Prs2 [Penicillium digitatum]
MAQQMDAQSPASKKLGSKLKKPKDSTKDEGSADAQKSTPSKKNAKSDKKDKKKRKSTSEDAAPETDSEMKKKKKRRHTEDDNDQKDEDDGSHKKKKKRVSFGPGTKEFDGDSESESDDADSNDAATTDGAEADTEDVGDKTAEEMKKRKREKKKQRKDGTASTELPIHETSILSYLSHYHRARATWKFQKNRETNLFKHLYSLEHVPSKYNTSLLAYMQGLKGDAAKVRMSNAARDVIKADMDLDKPKDDEESENQGPSTNPEYLEAINAFRECLPKGDEDLDNVKFGDKLEGDVQKRLPKRQRAELVFFAVAGRLFSAEDLKKPKSKPKAPEPPVNKKRKNRTMVVDISSSSEDSDDDVPAPKKAVSKPAPDSDDETSSSGSSSDSDSDSDNKSSVAPAPSKQRAASTPSSSAPSGVAIPKETKAAPKKKEKFVPARKEKLKPAVPKKTQKRKLRTARIEISSSESDSE